MRTQRDNDTVLDIVSAFEQAWTQYRDVIWRLLPLGVLVSIPPYLFFHSMLAGILFSVFFEGIALLLLVYTFRYLRHGTGGTLSRLLSRNMWFILKNGMLLSFFLFPLLILGFALLVLPSVFVFSFFMFSFFEVAVNERFAIDACMESYRTGHGYRIHLFLISLIIYASLVIIHILTDTSPLFFLVLNAFLVPYFVIVINELFEQFNRT